MGELADIARSKSRTVFRPTGEISAGGYPVVRMDIRREHDTTRRPGRRGRPDRYYAELAVAYEDWQGTRQPLRVLADELVMPLSTLRTALQIARRRGLLTAAPGKGRKGGWATDKARQRLEQGADDDGER